MATKVWKGHLSFGLLSIPCFLNVGARDKKIETRNFHVACRTPVNAPKYCKQCDVKLEPTEMFRGTEVGGKIVELSDAELEAITPTTGHSVEISETVPWSDIDPLFLAESFYVLPEDAGRKAYSLLVKTLTETGMVGIAQICKNGREHIAAIRPKDNGLVMHYLWYPDEVNKNADFDGLESITLTANELKLAKQLVESLAGEFQPEQFEDGYRQRLNRLIESKLDTSVSAPEPVKTVAKSAPVDISAALQQSLAAVKPRRKVAAEQPKAAKKSRKVA